MFAQTAALRYRLGSPETMTCCFCLFPFHFVDIGKQAGRALISLAKQGLLAKADTHVFKASLCGPFSMARRVITK